jgi:hypothetical protein
LKATNKEIGEEFGEISHATISMQYRHAEEEIAGQRGCGCFFQKLEKELNLQLKSWRLFFSPILNKKEPTWKH